MSTGTVIAIRQVSLEKYCGRNVKAVAEPFHLLPVELSFFLQDQGHNTLAAQVVGQVFLPEAIGRHQFAQHLDPRSLFDNEMLCFVVGDQNDEQFSSFCFFCTATRFALQFEKTRNVGFVLLGRRNDLRSLFFHKILSWQPFSSCRHFSTLLCRILCGSTLLTPLPFPSQSVCKISTWLRCS